MSSTRKQTKPVEQNYVDLLECIVDNIEEVRLKAWGQYELLTNIRGNAADLHIRLSPT